VTTRAQTVERTLILAPQGRDAVVAKGILREAALAADICVDLAELVDGIAQGNGDVAIITEEALSERDLSRLARWVSSQQPWSDFPFILLTRHGGGPERNPAAMEYTNILGNVTFLERPFHPTTLVSVVQTALHGRRRQHECRRLNEELETRVQERTAELAAANRQLLSQIEERERVETTLRQMQRLEAVGQLTSGVAHDFNNLLTVILGNVVFLEAGLAKANGDPKLQQRLSYMKSAAERGAKLTDQLLSFSRRKRLEPKSIDLNESVNSMRELLQSTLGGSIRIATKLSSDLWPASVDPTQLELAVLNLAINSRDAMEVGGTLTVSTDNVTLGEPYFPEEPPPGEYVEICVSDTGAGMGADVRAKVFEPFFTTKEIGKGSGLGLSQVLGFAKQSGGGVCINTRPGKGTSVHIYLPRAKSKELSVDVSESDRTDNRAARATILLVDDDEGVREVTAAILQDIGHSVIEAGSGGAALEALSQTPNVDLILIDFAMPGMNGAELARHVQTRRPRLPILFITGFADRTALAGVSESHIVSKPFTPDELGSKVQGALAERDSTNVVRLRG
jgi:signal transduction histidine kinase/CheY-like chemotaxis protein